MNFSVLVVDRNPAPGDSWKLRYDLLCLHTPKAYGELAAHLLIIVWWTSEADMVAIQGHPAYLPYPDDVPEWVPTARVAEQYCQLAERAGVQVRASSEVTRAKFNNATNKWQISIKPVVNSADQQDSSPASAESTSVEASFLVFAAGAGSQKPSMPNFPGRVSSRRLARSLSLTTHSG
jgi:putative flavoprotein involved in K+ transport